MNSLYNENYEMQNIHNQRQSVRSHNLHASNLDYDLEPNVDFSNLYEGSEDFNRTHSFEYRNPKIEVFAPDDPIIGCSYQNVNRHNQGDSDLCSWHTDQSSHIDRYHRTTSIHRNMFKELSESTTARAVPKSLETRRKWISSAAGQTLPRTSLIQRANNIANCMEKDELLMQNSPESELLRREALRDMPQCLTVKRIIKKKLTSTVNRHSKRKPLGFFKNLKYNISIQLSKIHNSLKSLAYSFELWYSSLKVIEGHFGSGVATYFKFFRWLFIMNFLIAICTFAFVILPQLLYVNISSVGYKNSTDFKFRDIFTGEGYFTNTALYYGFYTKEMINLINEQKYSMPYAYFFTMLCLYVVSFVVLSSRMAQSYRRSFIETQGGLKNVYAHKVFCGWDYSIATQQAFDLKAASIYHELKELLSDSVRNSAKVSCLNKFYTCVIQIVSNFIILVLLVATGYTMWNLLEQHNSRNENNEATLETIAVVTAIIINIIMLVFPIIFSFIVKYEDYKHPRAALYITLVRTFLLKTVVVGVFLGFWLTHSQHEKCWETSIGQHIYRLILFDFLFSIILAVMVEAVRYVVHKRLWKSIGAPEFDIARHTLQLMYNQTLFWVGFYFSPLLTVVVVIKLWCTWYIKRTFVLNICQPSSKSWRAAQTHTWFLILSFLSLLLVLIAYGYIIVGVETSDCGPFRDYSYIYEMILKGIFQLEQNNSFWKILKYLTKPGTVALILVGMCVVVYYLRSKAIAQKSMVNILRDMLVLEAKDKEFLLKNISKITEGKWQYNLQNQELWDSQEHRFNPAVQNADLEEIDGISVTSESYQDQSYPLCNPENPEFIYLHKRKCHVTN